LPLTYGQVVCKHQFIQENSVFSLALATATSYILTVNFPVATGDYFTNLDSEVYNKYTPHFTAHIAAILSNNNQFLFHYLADCQQMILPLNAKCMLNSTA